jgi:hypothetical protein
MRESVSASAGQVENYMGIQSLALRLITLKSLTFVSTVPLGSIPMVLVIWFILQFRFIVFSSI